MPQRDRMFRLGLFRSAGVNLTMPAVEMRHFLGRPASAPPRAYEKQNPFNEGRMIVGFFPATTMPDADWWQALWPDPAKVLVDMGVQPGMVVVDLCCGDGLFTAPLGRIADTIYAVDIDPAMLDRARAFVAAAGTTNCHFVLADAMTFDAVMPEPVDYVFLANTFHGVPDQLGLARAVAAILKPKGQFGVVNWHRRPREETVVLGQPRGPRTEMRIEASDVSVIVRPAGMLLNRSIELPPYHYAAIFAKQGE